TSGPPPPVVSAPMSVWAPNGVVSTMLPSPALAVRMSPFGASVIPSGPFRLWPRDTVNPPPVTGKKRNGASGRLDPAVLGVGDVQRPVTPEGDAGRPD